MQRRTEKIKRNTDIYSRARLACRTPREYRRREKKPKRKGRIITAKPNHGVPNAI